MVPHTVVNRYGIPFPAVTRLEEKSVKTMLARVMGMGRAVPLHGCRRGWKACTGVSLLMVLGAV